MIKLVLVPKTWNVKSQKPFPDLVLLYMSLKGRIDHIIAYVFWVSIFVGGLISNRQLISTNQQSIHEAVEYNEGPVSSSLLGVPAVECGTCLIINYV